MATCTLDIRIGVDGSQKKDLYKNIDVTIELHQEKVAKISQQLASLLNKTVTPLVVFEYPETGSENNEIFNFKAHDYDTASTKIGSKVYQHGNPRNKDTIKLLKNFEKQFQKITKLNNLCSLKLSLYDILKQELPQNKLSLLNHSKIKGNIQGDPELINSLTEIIRRISNQFLNSPFMAFLQLLENLTLKLNLASIEEFTQDVKQSYLSYLDFSSWINKENISELRKLKGQLVIHITLPKLLSIKIKGEAAVFATFFSIFL